MTAELFAQLELEPGANRDQIRAAYFRLAKTLHPDRQAGDDPDATEKFLAVQRAYEVLMDPELRLEYEKAQARLEEELNPGKRKKGSTNLPSYRPVITGRPAIGVTEGELQDAERAYQRALDLLQSGRSEPALRAMQAVVRVAPRFPRYRSLLGYCLALEGKNLHAARDHCRYAVEAEPFDADHQARLGFVYQQAGLQRTADKCFAEAMRIEPTNAIALAHTDQEQPTNGGFVGALKRIFKSD